MLKKLLITVSIFSLAFFFFSCGSNNPFEPANEDYSLYFPLTPGSQWKYVEYPILKDGRKYEELASYYNAFINSYVTILGKKASEFSFYTPTDTLKRKEYFAFEDNKIYTLLSYFFYFIPQGKEPDRWVVIADFNRKPGEEWMILKDFELYTEQLPPRQRFRQRYLLCFFALQKSLRHNFQHQREKSAGNPVQIHLYLPHFAC